MWFPVMGSAVLFGLYILFTYFSKEYINYLLTAYFGKFNYILYSIEQNHLGKALLGVAAMTKALSAVFDGLRPVLGSVNHAFSLQINRLPALGGSKKKSATVEEESALMLSTEFDFLMLGCGVVAILFTAYYVMTKHWIASNIFGEAFSISAIQLLDLDDFKTGMLLLSGLFFYDIFWVSNTNTNIHYMHTY